MPRVKETDSYVGTHKLPEMVVVLASKGQSQYKLLVAKFGQLVSQSEANSLATIAS